MTTPTPDRATLHRAVYEAARTHAPDLTPTEAERIATDAVRRANARPGAPVTTADSAYMPITPFDPDDQSGGRYEAEVDAEGPLIYSECCMDRMSLATARQFVAATSRWIADQDAEGSDR